MSRGDPFYGGGGSYTQPTPDMHIPRRFRDGAGKGKGKSKSKRDAEKEVTLNKGPIPEIGEMGEEEYITWIREGMDRLKYRAEVSEREKRAREREEKERAREMEKEREERDQRRKQKAEKRKSEKEIEVQQRKMEGVLDMRRKGERQRYRDRWKPLVKVGGELELVGLGLEDIPWPVYRTTGLLALEDLDFTAIGEFFAALAGDEPGSQDAAFKKILREAIRAFHPDRFFGRILLRVKEADREKVREGVERCSRVINELAARQ